MHTTDGEQVVDCAGDEEDREETEEVVGSLEGARETGVDWDRAICGRCGEGLEGSEFTAVLDRLGDEEGDDVVDCEGRTKELDDEGGWAVGASCAVGHEWW